MSSPLPSSIGRPATNALTAAGISCLEDLAKISEKELSDLHGVGPKAVRLLKSSLDESDLHLLTPESVQPKKTEIIDGFTIKYHANGLTRWSKGKVVDGQPDGYWEWYRPDGTRKRSGHFKLGEAVGEWTTYNDKGEVYKVTTK